MMLDGIFLYKDDDRNHYDDNYDNDRDTGYNSDTKLT